MRRFSPWPLLLLLAALAPATAAAQASAASPFQRGDRVVFIGNTFAERMSLFPHFEARLTALRRADSLTFRNLAWSGDEVALQPRPLNFGDLHTHLAEQKPDVILAFFGMNESFAGAEGLPKFRADLAAFLQGLTGRSFNGEAPPRVVLVSPIAHERVERVPLDPAAHNRDLEAYTAAMREVAARAGVGFVDLFTPTRPLVDDPALGDLTINGIHPNDAGYEVTGHLLLTALGLQGAQDVHALAAGRARCRQDPAVPSRGALLDAVRDKNELFVLRWRAVNGEYIYGRRKEPFGVVNFPPEMRKLEEMISAKEREIWTLAGKEPLGVATLAQGCIAASAR